MKKVILILMLLAYSCYLPGQNEADLLNMGKSKISSQQYSAALQHFEALILMNPHHAEAYYLSGKIRSLLGDTMGGSRDFQKAYNLDPLRFQRNRNTPSSKSFVHPVTPFSHE